MKHVLILTMLFLTFISLDSCVTKSKYEKVLSSKERLSRSLMYTEKEFNSLQERTTIILDKFDKESQNIENLTKRVNSLAELVKTDSVEIAKYKVLLSDFQEQVKLSNEKNVLLTANYEQKIQAIIVKYNIRINSLNRKLRREKFLYNQLLMKTKKDNERN